MSRAEVQGHGFSWEKDILQNVYKLSEETMNKIKYTSKMDLPKEYNILDRVDLSIKTTCSANAVCMADAVRIFDAVNSGSPFHMTVIQYKQNDVESSKKLICITEVDLTNSAKELFGCLTRDELVSLDSLVKAVPQKRKPTEEEYKTMYSLRDTLQAKCKAIHLDIKCNSQQSRLQCSFNHFQTFLSENPDRKKHQSTTGEFRGASIITEIKSGRRVFKKKSGEVSD
jgi:hypothetical protein